MPCVITDACVDIMDRTCVDLCPVDCIQQGERMFYINPDDCIDCGACEPVCPQNAIYLADSLPAPLSGYQAINADSHPGWTRRPVRTASVRPGRRDHRRRTGPRHRRVVALCAWRRFPGTVFLSYAAFWFSYVLIVQFYAPSVVAKGGNPTAAIGWFLVAYAVVTTYFFITALATTKTLALLFTLLLVGFYTVAAATFTGNSTIGAIAGWVLLADALVALYLSAALTMNDAWGRTLLPTP